MSLKSLFAVLLLTAVVSIAPMAQATTTIEVTMAGSSGAWQALGIGTYDYCVKTYTAANCFHWTSKSNVVNLTDTRVTPVNNDAGTLWVVWEGTSSAASKVWSDDKVDTVVGNRCFWAQPQCNVNATGANLALIGSQIAGFDLGRGHGSAVRRRFHLPERNHPQRSGQRHPSGRRVVRILPRQL